MRIRRATEKDAYTLAVLTHRFFPYTGLGCPEVLCRLRSKNIEYYAAIEDKATVGFTDLEHQGGGKAKILGLAVLPEYRRRGIGQALLDKALAAALAKGDEKCVILVAEDNLPAQGLYEKNGFSHCGVLDRKLWNKTVLLMSKEL